MTTPTEDSASKTRGLNLLARLSKARKTAKSNGSNQDTAAGNSSDSVGVGGDTPTLITPEVKRYAYVRWLIRVLTASVILNGVAVGVLLVTGLVIGQRPTMQLNAAPSLKSEADNVFGKKTEVNVDDLLLYINTVLPLMHRLDDRGAPELPLLRGLVAPVVYDKAVAESAKGSELAKKNYIIQSLVVTRVDDVVTDNERGRLSAYVRGYLAIIIQSSNKSVILPYRAEVLLEMAPPSRLNRFPFVLIRREWRIDKAALDWDENRAGSSLPAKASPK